MRPAIEKGEAVRRPLLAGLAQCGLERHPAPTVAAEPCPSLMLETGQKLDSRCRLIRQVIEIIGAP
jgi:hypothetical protein